MLIDDFVNYTSYVCKSTHSTQNIDFLIFKELLLMCALYQILSSPSKAHSEVRTLSLQKSMGTFKFQPS